MGSKSKSLETGAFGSPKLTAAGALVVRPNRGRSRWKNWNVVGKPRLKLGQIVKKSAEISKAEPAPVKEPVRTGLMARMKQAFNRKGA